MHPFDIKTVLLAKHAQHVVLIHFPIALFIAGVGCDLVALRTRDPITAAVARCNLLLAALFVPPVLLTGLLAWKWALDGQAFNGVLLWHLLAGCVAGALIVAVGCLHLGGKPHTGRPLARYRWFLEVVAVLLVGLTAHLGGFLSGVNIPG